MIDNELTAKGFRVWGICAFFFLYEFLLRTIMGTYQHPVMHDLHLTTFQFSLLSSTIFLMIYGFMQIPVGIIVDNIGLKRSLLIGALTCSCAAIGFSYSYTYGIAIAFRMLMGFGASFGFICLLISVSEWMPHKYSAIFIGLSQFIGTLGPMLAAGPLASISKGNAIQWRFVFLVLGGVGFLLTVLILLFVENAQEKAGRYVILHKPQKISTSISKLFSRIQPWYIALLTTSLYFTIEYLSENEGRAFLVLKGASATSASYILSIAWIGYAIGCPLLGFLSDFLERRLTIMKISAALGLAAIVIILYAPGILVLQCAFFALGVSASGQSIGFAMIAENFKPQFLAVGYGFNNAMLTAFAAINAPCIGLVLDYTKEGSTLSLHEYLFVFNGLIVIAVIGLILSIFFVKETYCKSSVDFTILKP